MSEKRSRSGSGTTRPEIVAIAAAMALVLTLAIGAWVAFMMVKTLSDEATEESYLSNVLSRLDTIVSRATDADAEYRAFQESGGPSRQKAFTDLLVAIRTDYDELLNLTSHDQTTHAELTAAKAKTDKTIDSIRDALDYKRTEQGTQAIVVLGDGGSLLATTKQATAALQKRFQSALIERGTRPRELADRTALWLLTTWLLAAMIGAGIAYLAIRHARNVGRLQRRLRRESIYDSLTGLPNGVYLEEWLKRSLARAVRTQTKVSVLYFDINDFKQVNHGLGYSEGDKVLLEVAEKLRAITRSSDFVARIRNDSFAVVLPDIIDLSQVESAISRLNTISVVRSGLAIKTTVGAAIYPEDAESADNLLRLSRAAMYRNRQTRRAA